MRKLLFTALLLTIPVCAQASLLFSTTTSSAAIANTTNETAFSQSYTLASGRLTAGSVLRIRASGRITSIGAPSTTVTVRLGGQGIAVFTFWTDEAIDRTAHWVIDCEVITRTVDTLATSGVLSIGYANGHVTPRAPNEGEPGLIGGSELSGTFSLATSQSQVVDLTAKWNEAGEKNSIVMDTFTVEFSQVIVGGG